MQLGDVEGALAAYQRAAALDPGDGRSRLGQGVLLAREGRFGEAVGPLREAARLLPAPSAAFTLLGSCLLQLQDRPGAAEALRQAVQADPANAEARRLLVAAGG
jgi:Flp pilus assembly protein TadD